MLQSRGVLGDTGVVVIVLERGVGTHQELLLRLSRTVLLGTLLQQVTQKSYIRTLNGWKIFRRKFIWRSL